MTADVKLPPLDLEAEEAVLGAMLVNPNAISIVSEMLDPDDFFKPTNGAIFTSILRAWSSNTQSADTVTISAEHPEDKEYIFHIAEHCPVATNARNYADIVKRTATQRALIKAGQEIVEMGYSTTEEPQQLLDNAEAMVYKLRPDVAADTQSLKSVGERLITECINQEEPPSTPTGFRQVDDVIGGMYDGNLIILGARPGVGKTCVALNIATNVAREGTVLFFSLEMSKVELTERILSSLSGVSLKTIRRRAPGHEQQSMLFKAHDELAKLDMEVVDNPNLTMLSLKSRARQWSARRDVKLIVIDYLQLLRHGMKHESRYVEVSAISRDCKSLARELGVPVLALSQLNRASEGPLSDGKPKLSQLRESGALEQDADMVFLLSYPNEADTGYPAITLDVAKNRHGQTKEVILPWSPRFQKVDQ